MGARRSRRIGWERKICLALTQSWRISDSESCTCFPPFPSRSLLITSSNTPLSIIPSIVIIIIFFLSSQRNKETNKQGRKKINKQGKSKISCGIDGQDGPTVTYTQTAFQVAFILWIWSSCSRNQRPWLVHSSSLIMYELLLVLFLFSDFQLDNIQGGWVQLWFIPL